MVSNSMVGANHTNVDFRHENSQKAGADELKHRFPETSESYETVIVTVRNLLAAGKRRERQRG